jgi:hypothetical protein
MVRTNLEVAVKAAVAEWLEQRSELLKNVCQEVADELGPMIAGEVVRGLAQVLTPSDKDREINKLKAACLHVAEWIERALPDMSQDIHKIARSMAATLYNAVGPDIPFNVPPPADLENVSDALPEQQLDGGYQE